MVSLALAPRGERTRWIDALRGMAIAALVTYHVVYGLVGANLLPASVYSGWGPAGDLIRMPLMMFVAGLFVLPSMKKGAAVYLSGKVRRILWPFLIWSVLYIVIRIVTPGVNNPLGWHDLLMIPAEPQSHTWFLRTLFAYYVIALAVQWWGLPALIALALAMAASGGAFGHHVDSFLHLFLYFVLGMAARSALERKALTVAWPAAAVAVVAGFTLPALVGSGVKYTPAAIPLALLGIGGAVALVLALCRSRHITAALSYLGERSLQLYLAHVLAASSTRIVLTAAGVESIAVLFPAVLLAAVVGPLVLAEVVERFRIPFVFDWPRGALLVRRLSLT